MTDPLLAPDSDSDAAERATADLAGTLSESLGLDSPSLDTVALSAEIAREVATDSTLSADSPDSTPLVSLRRRRNRSGINFPILALILLLLELAGIAVLASLGPLPIEVQTGWSIPWLIIAGLWLLASFAGGRPRGVVGAAGALGVTISLVLESVYRVPLSATLIGVSLIALGMGIILRGLLFRAPILRS
jgi:hypothetical protein